MVEDRFHEKKPSWIWTVPMIAAAALRPGEGGLQINSMVSGGSQTARQVLEENKTISGVQGIFKLDETLAISGR
jgi:hypothetical protein